ncbi:uncharacterized protein LOC133464105 [Cololabis saira]|uniref:uncharacterized protein LOC133464105 n=1 Tax=Cololabis saira TaxID=129043 RepID=UPI002AD2F10A|nr:uncharacterized protein LOC133464105 [Cololabis saira]
MDVSKSSETFSPRGSIHQRRVNTNRPRPTSSPPPPRLRVTCPEPSSALSKVLTELGGKCYILQLCLCNTPPGIPPTPPADLPPCLAAGPSDTCGAELAGVCDVLLKHRTLGFLRLSVSELHVIPGSSTRAVVPPRRRSVQVQTQRESALLPLDPSVRAETMPGRASQSRRATQIVTSRSRRLPLQRRREAREEGKQQDEEEVEMGGGQEAGLFLP